jgi:hypothetical protein
MVVAFVYCAADGDNFGAGADGDTTTHAYSDASPY